MTQHMEIAKTIRNQITAIDPYAFWAYGAKDFVALTEKREETLVSLGGLSFRVNGLKHKGHVIINLMGNDTYTVRTWKIVMSGKNIGKSTMKEEREGVHFDELVAVLDEFVEGKVAA